MVARHGMVTIGRRHPLYRVPCTLHPLHQTSGTPCTRLLVPPVPCTRVLVTPLLLLSPAATVQLLKSPRFTVFFCFLTRRCSFFPPFLIFNFSTTCIVGCTISNGEIHVSCSQGGEELPEPLNLDKAPSCLSVRIVIWICICKTQSKYQQIVRRQYFFSSSSQGIGL